VLLALFKLRNVHCSCMVVRCRTVQVIFETGALTKEEIVDASLLSIFAGADFVKTSTGFGPGAATVCRSCLVDPPCIHPWLS